MCAIIKLLVMLTVLTEVPRFFMIRIFMIRNLQLETCNRQ